MPADPAAAKALFLEAAAIDDPVARVALLIERCGADAELRARVEALLLANDRAVANAGTASFESAPGGEPVQPTADHADRDEHAGAVISGKYTLVEVIGAGGMGSVWRAKQTEPIKRFVAVKLIKAGMDSKSVLARFEAERQALALMDHPNIAKVLDGGLHDGRPFFVMELVKGVPITEYCDKCRLTPKERLELFVPVCQAIQHAHQKGIIHRDIKPSNVLVALYDDRPVVKVIDFGVAKATGGALTEHTIDTGFGGVVGTPQYMSPEQATFNNLDIDTRSDVYALGVLLYELLTGSPPFTKKELEKKGLLEILRVVREEEPPRPSTKLSTADALPTLSANRGTEPKKLAGLLRNELDWIVMKALEKDRTRRYESANGFAADILRYLSGEAVLAHPPSCGYRLKKFVRRNKGQVIAVGLVMFALLAGVVGTTLGMIRADRARADESAQRDIAVENERLAKVAERDATRASERAKASEAHAKTALDNADKLLGIQEWLSRGSEKRYSPDQLATLQGLAAQFEGVANNGTRPDAAEAFTRLAAVQRLLNKPAEQRKSLERSLELWIDLVRTDPASANGSRVQVAKARRRLAGTFEFKSPVDPQYLALLRQAAADWRAATDADPTNAAAWSERALVLRELEGWIPASHGYAQPSPLEAAAEQAAVRREAIECMAKAVELRPGDQALWLQLLRFHGDSNVSPDAVRVALRAATRFPDEPTPRRFKPFRDEDYPYARDRETFDSDLCVRIISGRISPVVGEWKANPAWLPEEAFRRGIAEPCREVLKEFPGYKYASGIEFLLKLREARAAEWVPETPPKPGEPPLPAQPTAEQRQRAAELYRQALELARKPETKLPTEFLSLSPREKDYFEQVQRPQKSIPMTAEEYVWFHRLGSIWAVPDGVLDEFQRELIARKDWRPTPMFLHRVLLATLPDEIIYDMDVPKEKLIARWMQADALFARIQAGVPRDGEDSRMVADRFSATAINVAARFRAMGERAHAKQAMTRCIQLIEEKTPRPDEDDWRYRTRCYFDRGNLHLDGGEWAAAARRLPDLPEAVETEARRVRQPVDPGDERRRPVPQRDGAPPPQPVRRGREGVRHGDPDPRGRDVPVPAAQVRQAIGAVARADHGTRQGQRVQAGRPLGAGRDMGRAGAEDARRERRSVPGRAGEPVPALAALDPGTGPRQPEGPRSGSEGVGRRPAVRHGRGTPPVRRAERRRIRAGGPPRGGGQAARRTGRVGKVECGGSVQRGLRVRAVLDRDEGGQGPGRKVPGPRNGDAQEGGRQRVRQRRRDEGGRRPRPASQPHRLQGPRGGVGEEVLTAGRAPVLPVHLFCPRGKAGLSRGPSEVSRRGVVQRAVARCTGERLGDRSATERGLGSRPGACGSGSPSNR